MPLIPSPTRRSFLVGTAASALSLTAQASIFHFHHKKPLSNPHASPRTRKLYEYLWSIYGHKTLTGQQVSAWRGPRAELDYIQTTTGKLPAILGLDYINPDQWTFVADRATKWYMEEGGIPTICWHWGAPDIGTGYENSKKDFDLPAALRPGTPQNAAMNRDLAGVANQLTILRDRDIPVLWRPLHEFTGSWFWWGKHGPEAFKALYLHMYDYFTNTRGLNNLIWVCAFSGEPKADWYPGAAYVDIAGPDTYVKDNGNLAPLFAAVKAIVGDTKPICLHECGPIPDPALLGRDSEWLYFMTWTHDWIEDPKLNPPDFLKRAYNSARYITRDEVPDLKNV
jgi:mannan endo-1,4-beta-mannosidase